MCKHSRADEQQTGQRAEQAGFPEQTNNRLGCEWRRQEIFLAITHSFWSIDQRQKLGELTKNRSRAGCSIQVIPGELMKNGCAIRVPEMEIIHLLCLHAKPWSDRHKHTAERQTGNAREQGTQDTLGKEGSGLLIPNTKSDKGNINIISSYHLIQLAVEIINSHCSSCCWTCLPAVLLPSFPSFCCTWLDDGVVVLQASSPGSSKSPSFCWIFWLM